MIFNNIEDVNKNIDNIDKNSCNNSDEINDKVIRKTIIKSLISIVGVMLLTILVFIKPSVNSIITKIYYLLSLIASFGLVLLMPKVFDYILKKGEAYCQGIFIKYLPLIYLIYSIQVQSKVHPK